MKKFMPSSPFLLTGLLLLLFKWSCAFTEKTVPNDHVKEQARSWLQHTNGFEVNRGQLPAASDGSQVLFSTEAAGITVYITDKGLSYFFRKNSATPEVHIDKTVHTEWHRVDMELTGANIKLSNTATFDPLPAAVNYYKGAVQFSTQRFEKILIENIYPGIDWQLYNKSDQGMKYDFIVHPGADPSLIKMHFTGMEDLELGDEHTLKIKTGLGELLEGNLFCYEKSGRILRAKYLLEGKDISLSIPTYNKQETLIIDPPLVWSTFYGGANFDLGNSITIDANGNIYVSGETTSPNFPLLNLPTGHFAGYNNNRDLFLLKFTSKGVLLWATYIGGSDSDQGGSLAADALGYVYMTGTTKSLDFPVYDRPGGIDYFNDGNNGDWDAFVLKIDPLGAIHWGTYYGGSGADWAIDIAVDSDRNIYVLGETGSTDLECYAEENYFLQDTSAGGQDLFILKFSSNCSKKWFTYLGGISGESAGALVTDPFKNVFITGSSNSVNLMDSFILTVGTGIYYMPVMTGTKDVFIIKFSMDGIAEWATFFGGGMTLLDGGTVEEVYEMVIDHENNVLITGETDARDFPTEEWPGGYNKDTLTGKIDAFVSKFSNNGKLLWSTYFGGSENDQGTGLAISVGELFFSGITYSPDIYTYKPSNNPKCAYFQDVNQGGMEMFMVRFNKLGTLNWSTYIGGPQNELESKLAADGKGFVYVAGSSVSDNFPTMNPGKNAHFQGAKNLLTDVIVMKIGSPIPIANFDFTQVCQGSTTVFHDTSFFGDLAYKWSWSFGDPASGAANTSTMQHPTHVFSTSGTFTVRLTITDSTGCSISNTANKAVTVDQPASVDAGPNLATCKGQPVNLAGTIGGSASSATWTTNGSGTFTDPTLLSAVYVPSLADLQNGSVVLILTTNDPTGACPAVSDNMIVTFKALDNAAFNYPTNTWCPTGMATPTVLGLKGGTFSASAGLAINAATGSITLEGATPGNYTVTYLTNGECPTTASQTIKVIPVPSAAFSYGGPYCRNAPINPLPALTGSGGTFSATPSGLVFSNIQNGQISLPPSFPGTYTVTYSIAATAGCPAVSATSTVTVIAVPKATFTINSTTCSDVQNIATYTGGASAGASYSWDFDGSAASGQGPHTVSWSSPGSKSITLQVTENGCPSTPYKTTVNVNSPPFAYLSNPSDTIEICSGQSTLLKFEFQGTAPWTATYTENGIQKTFTSIYNSFTLPVSNPGWYSLVSVASPGCDTALSDDIFINRLADPVTSLEMMATKACEGSEIEGTIHLSGSKDLFDIEINGGAYALRGISDNYPVNIFMDKDSSFVITSVSYSDSPKCTRSVNLPVTLQVIKSPQTGQPAFTCDANGKNYKVDFTIYSGDAASYTVNGIGSGPNYASSWIPSGESYSFTITDKYNCQPVVLEDKYRCNCFSNSGSISSEPIDICANLAVVVPHAGDHTLDVNDSLEFLLHDGQAPSWGQVIMRNSSGIFTFQPGMQYDKEYYITAIAGDYNTDGTVNLADPCLDFSEPVPVIFRKVPEMEISQVPNDSLCYGDSAFIAFEFEGTGPFTITWRDDAQNYNTAEVNSGDLLSFDRIYKPSAWSITEVQGAYCKNTRMASFSFFVPAPLSVDTSSKPLTCAGQKTGTLAATASGSYGGYIYQWKDNNGAVLANAASLYNIGEGDYQLTVRDKMGCQVQDQYTFADGPHYQVSKVEVINETCYNSGDGRIVVTAPAGYLYCLKSLTPWQKGDTFNLRHFNQGLNTYTIEVQSAEGCFADTQITVTGLEPIVLTHSPDQAFCKGVETVLKAAATGGNEGFTYFWNNTEGGPEFKVSPQEQVNRYSVYAADTNNCLSEVKTITLVLPDPFILNTATDVAFCQGDSFRLSAAVTGGAAPYNITWKNALGEVVGTGAEFAAYSDNDLSFEVLAMDSCGSMETRNVALEIVEPSTVYFEARDDTSGCAPLKVTFLNQSQGDYDQVHWKAGSAAYSNSEQMIYTFDKPGLYDVSLMLVNTRAGCTYQMERKQYVQVFPAPKASFDFFPKQVSLMDPEIATYNLSQLAEKYEWRIDEQLLSDEKEPRLIVPGNQPQRHQICLATRSAEGCEAITCKNVEVYGETAFYLPNSFTPNGDGKNDIFKLEGVGIDGKGFLLQVFNRWGQLIFESRDINHGWNGEYKHEVVKTDYYTWKLEIEVNGELLHKMGTVQILR